MLYSIPNVKNTLAKCVHCFSECTIHGLVNRRQAVWTLCLQAVLCCVLLSLLISLEESAYDLLESTDKFTNMACSINIGHLCTHTLTYLLTYLLTPYNTVLLEKLAGFQLVKKFPAFYGTTRKFITVLTSAHHLSLS